MSLTQLPARLTAGAFVLNAGLGKKDLPEDAAEQMQAMASAGVPALQKLTPAQFKTFLTVTEVGIGAALLAPFVPGWLAGAALTAFSGGLLNMYRKTPGLTIDGIRPTEEGTAIAKDVFMLGIGASLIIDSLTTRSRRRKAKKAQAA